MVKEKSVRCFFTKNTDGYYGGEFKEIDEKNNKLDIGQFEWPYKYSKEIVTYKIISYTNDLASRKIQTRAITVGVRAIGLHVKNIKFRRERDITKETDIEIYFTNEDPAFLKSPQVLAYTHLVQKDPSKKPKDNKIVFNDKYYWTLYGENIPANKIDPIHYKKDDKTKLKTESLLHVFMHEFMHKIGLRHDLKNKDAIMWPYAKSADHKNAFILHQNDITRLQNKYGKRVLSKRIIETMRERRLKGVDFKRIGESQVKKGKNLKRTNRNKR